jgi:hypothetical protein
MKMVVELAFGVKIDGDRANANEVFDAARKAVEEVEGKLVQAVVEEYQKRVVAILCSASGSQAKKGLGRHEVKGEPGKWCRGRRFRRAGYWKETRRLRGSECEAEFLPALVKCCKCGKRFTPILDALELAGYQRKTDALLRKVAEAIAETSYRRGSAQLEIFGEMPVPKSTAHRWVAEVELPVQASQGKPILSADGTGFKRQPGQHGEVRFVLEIGENGDVHPLGVWAGARWEEIAKEVKDRLAGQPRLFLSDAERGLENWLGRLATDSTRCHWHFSRHSGYAMWHDGAPLSERKEVQKELTRLLAIELPSETIEEVSEEEKAELRRRLQAAEAALDDLHRGFAAKGYEKAALYLANARDRLFGHLRLWLETGIVCPRTTSIVENLIRELVRRLKKIGWNWSDAGATRMGRMVMIRRYDEETWRRYWERRMNLQGRCSITLTKWESKTVA